MQLEFAHGWVLFFLPLLWAVIIALRVLDEKLRGFGSTKTKSRELGENIVRCLVMSLVLLAISGPSVKKVSHMITTVFVIDMSDSMNNSIGGEIDFVKSAISKMPDKNQAGIVVFGQDAKIEQFVSSRKVFTEVSTDVVSAATNLEQAVSTAMALFPEDSAKRIVLLTDGAENDGNIADIAASVTNANIEFKIQKYETSVENEVYISDVSLPDTISEGDQFEVTVNVYSTDATKATVSLYSGRTLKGQKNVKLQKGDNQLVFSDQGLETGIKNYKVTVEAEKDTVSLNNTYSAFTNIKSQAKLLIVEGDKNQSLEFQKVLDAGNFDYDVVTPSGVPGSVSDMLQYQSIIMLDVYADDLRNGFTENIETFVKDYAGGFVCIGGSNSYALGNYRDTPIEEVLPVNMDLEGEKEIPSIAMTMVIDHSGSMSSASTENGSTTCLDVAKQAAINSLDALREIDEVGVIAFDDAYAWAVPMQKAEDKSAIEDGIIAIENGGGTSIYPAVEAAADEISKSQAAIKHIVLLTDGEDSFRDYDDLIARMKDNGITLSTVGIGAGTDVMLLENLADKCDGRYYYSDASTTLPRIFAQEVYLSTQQYLINEEFVPVISNSHEIIQGVFDEGSPTLLGYVACSAKNTSTVILESDREDPILTVWQYGLGKTVAWCSDGEGKWTGNFSGWDNYASLWKNIIDFTVYNQELGDDTLKVSQKASSAVIDYETGDYSSSTKVSAIITDEEGNQKEVSLVAISPGRYSAEVPLAETGVYSINLRKNEGAEVVSSYNTATAMQYSQEYRYEDISTSIESFINQTNARIIEEPTEVFDTELEGAMSRKNLSMLFMILIAIFFLADVVCRRMQIDWLAVVAAGLRKASDSLWGQTKANEIAASVKKKETIADKTSKDKSAKEKSVNDKSAEDKADDKKKAKSIVNKGKTAKKEAKKDKPKNQVNTIDTAALLKKKEERKL